MPELNLQQATDLLGMFGGEDAAITVDYCPDGHAGAGIYAWHTDYPDEGSVLLMGEGGHRGRQAEAEGSGPRPTPLRLRPQEPGPVSLRDGDVWATPEGKTYVQIDNQRVGVDELIKAWRSARVGDTP